MMQMMLRNNINHANGSEGAMGSGVDFASRQAALASPLVEVLWRRRWTVGAVALACLIVGFFYICVATRIYRATAQVSIHQNAPKVFAENQGYVAESDSFLQTQADVFESKPVLQRAFDQLNYRGMKSFANVGDDPVDWLRRSGALKVEAGKKSDVISVSMEGTNPDDIAAFANSLVNAFISLQGDSKRATGDAMVKVLETQQNDLKNKLADDDAQILKYKASFRDSDSNASPELTRSLEQAVTAASIATIELRAQLASTNAALETPDTIHAFVVAQQAKAGRDGGDREYDEIRSQLTQYSTAAMQNGSIQGSNNPRVAVLRSTIDSLNKRLDVKMKSMVEAQLASVASQLAASQQKERELKSALAQQQGDTLNQTPAAQACKKLEAETDQLQKQIEVLGTRIAEVHVNSYDAGSMSAEIIEPAAAEKKPVRPAKTLVLAVALMAGLVFGAGGAMFREHQDARVRSADEITSLFGVPLLASVPRVNPRLSSTARGQLLRLDPRSAAAEAYRSVRTSLHLGAAGVAKTVLVASPTSGDGKSTTAANLAIAFAEAGDRTLLIDCDLRRPVQHLIFELEGEAGLSTVMSGEAKLRAAISPTRSPNLFVLPCGPLPHNPTELLTSKRFGRLMQALTETFDRIVIDSPPLGSVADGRVLAAPADCTVLVFRVDHSSRALAAVSIEGLEKVGANVVGAIANDVQVNIDTRYYGGSWAPVSSQDQQLLGSRHQGSPSQHALPINEAAGFNDGNELAVNEPDWSAELS